MVTQFERQSIVDEEHLKLLSLGFWAWGGFTALYTLLVAAYFAVLGTVFMAIPSSDSAAPPPFLGWVFLGVGAGVVLLVGGWGALEIAAGFWIRRRKHRVATMVIAAMLCPAVPFGTFVGVSTLIVLGRPSVKSLYDVAQRGLSTPAVLAPQDTTAPDAAGAGT